MHVRVRRDADEQMVLAHVYHRLANLVSVLTVQIFKDDWSRPSAFQILGDASLLSKPADGRSSVQAPTVSATPAAYAPYTAGSQQMTMGSGPYKAGTYGMALDGGTGTIVQGSTLRSALLPHAGLRFPSIPHYTDMAAGSLPRLSTEMSPGSTGNSGLDFTVPTSIREDKGAKYK